ncbi:hypothetical protein DEU52_101288 [Ensifer adhaerens]|nr:hypothetical protein DEU52_101288 [Ensifer adhaerens]
MSSWDIIAGTVKPEGPLYDDNGAYSGMMAAELIARGGGALEIVSPERMFAPEVAGMNHVPYATAFAEHNVRVTINTRVKSVRRECNGLVATLGSDFSDKATIKGRVAPLVVEHGTVPMDDLYRELKPLSRKLGGVDYKALLRGENPTPQKNLDARFDMFRIGDAVASRNIHAGIYDAQRDGVLV